MELQIVSMRNIAEKYPWSNRLEFEMDLQLPLEKSR
jgi:hypothetical protein